MKDLIKIKRIKKQLRKNRTKAKIKGTKKVPRLSVYKSLTHIYAQIIDDSKGVTLAAVNDKAIKKGKKTEKSFAVGEEIAKKALDQKITNVVFDRGSFKYIGRVKALAEGARKAGLKF